MLYPRAPPISCPPFQVLVLMFFECSHFFPHHTATIPTFASRIPAKVPESPCLFHFSFVFLKSQSYKYSQQLWTLSGYASFSKWSSHCPRRPLGLPHALSILHHWEALELQNHRTFQTFECSNIINSFNKYWLCTLCQILGIKQFRQDRIPRFLGVCVVIFVQ